MHYHSFQIGANGPQTKIGWELTPSLPVISQLVFYFYFTCLWATEPQLVFVCCYGLV